MDSHLLHGDNIPTESLSKTNWKDFIDPFIGTLGPSFFVLHIWQSFPHGDIRDDEIMSKLICLSSGYELWENTAKYAVEHLDDILSVMDTITTSIDIKKYLDPTRDKKFGMMALVQSDDYPVAARIIKDLFQVSLQTNAPALTSFPT